MAKTIRCDVLKRMAVAGNLLYVGGYTFDDLTGAEWGDHGKAPLPVKYLAEGESRGPDGTVYLKDYEFDHGIRVTTSTLANGLTLIHVRHHSNRYDEFYRKDEWDAHATKLATEAVAVA